MSRKNTFSRALRHLNQITEGIPTNNTQGLYTIGDPSEWVPPEDNTYTELDFNKDNDEDDGKNTDGIFLSDGTILTVEPPGDTSYVLGPMSSMWYAWGNFTRTGYIRQSDRKMVNLGSITGELGDWDGSSNFTSYGQLTLEQAVWFKNIEKKDGGGDDDPNYRAFYPGPPSNTPDEFGRYLCVITGKPKEFGDKIPGYTTRPEQGPGDASDNYSAQQGRDKGDKPERKKKKKGDTQVAWEPGDPWPSKEGPLDGPQGPDPNRPWVPEAPKAKNNQGGDTKIANVDDEAWKLHQLGHPKAGEFHREHPGKNNPYLSPRDVHDLRFILPGLKTANMLGPNTPLPAPGWQKKTDFTPKPLWKKPKPAGGSGKWGTSIKLASYEPQGRVITESSFTQRKKKILREVKKPYNMPEVPTKFKVKPKVRVVGDGLMKNKSVPPQFKPTSDNRMWRKSEYKENIRASQEKKNQVLELIGEGDHQWNYMLNNERWRTSQQMEKLYGNHDYLYDYYYGGKNHKVLRKENLEKDFLLFLEDEDGVKSNILQSELNDLLAYEKDNEDFKDHYLYETEQNEREKNFDRVNKIKKVVSQSTKKRDIAPEYPKDPPPEMINGWHPKLADGKDIANRYNKLDPQSAEAMPKTGNPHIDAKVEKAKNKPK